MFCPQCFYRKGSDGKLYLVYVNEDKSIVNNNKYEEFNGRERFVNERNRTKKRNS